MNKYELKPTYENLLNTFVKDTIGRNKDIFIFSDILNSVSDACPIAIDGSWGSGKTFFVKQTKMYLDSHNSCIKSIKDKDKNSIKKIKQDNALKPQVSVYYDAWENDNDTDPILSLVYSIVCSVETDYSFDGNIDVFEKAAKVLEFFTGKNFTSLISVFKNENALNEIKKTRGIENEIKDFLDSLLLEKGERLIVFIDELDRCKPSYAVKLLERIKHYFDNNRITFVFSINTDELQSTIKKHYGNDFNACRYLDRFFDLRVILPPPDLTKYYNSLAFDENNYTYDSLCGIIIKNYNFTLREIGRFIRITKMAAHKITHDSHNFVFPDQKATQFCIYYIVPIMIGLNLYSRDNYKKFISGNDVTPLIENLSEFIWHFNGLLDNNETYYKEENKKSVTLDEKLKLVYDTLFNTVYTSSNYQIKVGNYLFNEKTRQILFEVVGLLSEYTTIENDSEENKNER